MERDLREGIGRLARIEKANLAVALALALAAALGWGGRAAASLVAGAALVEAGLRIWRWILLGAFREPGRPVRGVGCKVLLKVGLLLPAVWVLVVKVKVEPLPFAVGVGTLLAALVLEALRPGAGTEAEGKEGTGRG